MTSGNEGAGQGKLLVDVARRKGMAWPRRLSKKVQSSGVDGRRLCLRPGIGMRVRACISIIESGFHTGFPSVFE